MCLGKGAPVITSADCLLSVFTQIQDTLQRLNILIITRTSSSLIRLGFASAQSRPYQRGEVPVYPREENAACNFL